MMPMNKHVALAAALAGALDEILNIGNGFSCEYTEAQAERGEMELATYREFLKGRE